MGAAASTAGSVTLKPAGDTMPTFPCLYPMKVMRWQNFSSLDHIPRSDEAQAKGLLEDGIAPGSICIFISHSWWERSESGSAPDFTSGTNRNLKFKTICSGISALIERGKLDASTLTLWCDYFSIDQIDEEKKRLGVQSTARHEGDAAAMCDGRVEQKGLAILRGGEQRWRVA